MEGHALTATHRLDRARRGRAASRADGAVDVLVAGASRGIGAAIATGFARDGARRVVLVGRTRADLERVAEDVRARGRDGRRRRRRPHRRRRRARCRGGRGRARRRRRQRRARTSPSRSPTWRRRPSTGCSALNVRAAFFVAQAAAQALRATGAAAASRSCRRRWATSAPCSRTVYCATKHAVEGLVKAMAVELRAPTASASCPWRRRSSRTEMTRRAARRSGRSARSCSRRSRSGGYASPDDVADAVRVGVLAAGSRW